MRLVIKKRSNFPKCVQEFKELKGICVGECIDNLGYYPPDSTRIGRYPYPEAHAHSHNGDPWQGYICLAYKRLLADHYTLLHEVAHLIANTKNEPSHGKEWRTAVMSIGGTYKPYEFWYRGKDYSYSVDLSHADPIYRS
jgi:hypothetical protein